MSRLIVVSNRITLPDSHSEAGGLAVALKEALERKGGIWCGWSGKLKSKPVTHTQTSGKVNYLTIDLTKKDYKDFYIGFCNSVLWPLFHYQMGMTQFNREMYEGYERVNRMFAFHVDEAARPDDTIWVHDYQMITLGGHLRNLGMKNRIGFFLHIPFPAPEVLSTLPVSNEIIKSLCAYDVVGFQTEDDLHTFLRSVKQLAPSYTQKRSSETIYEVHAFGRHFKAGSFPISIDTEDMAATAEQAEFAPQTMQLKNSLFGRSVLIGVDRLDYTKGLVQRVEAFNHFLQHYPEHLHKVSYVQITPPSRTDVQGYRKIRGQLESLAAHVNGMNADIDWVPIRYINKSFSRESLSGFYRLAKVGLVTPVRDGMNLVAKEYVASQNPLDPGVLILSQFAGAARELDAALIVNPFDVESMSEAMHKALSMGLDERKERYSAMMKVLVKNDIFHWTNSFMECLQVQDVSRPQEYRRLDSRYTVQSTGIQSSPLPL